MVEISIRQMLLFPLLLPLSIEATVIVPKTQQQQQHRPIPVSKPHLPKAGQRIKVTLHPRVMQIKPPLLTQIINLHLTPIHRPQRPRESHLTTQIRTITLKLQHVSLSLIRIVILLQVTSINI